MKIRMGFVSNSSSSCFILDARKPATKDILKKIKKIHADYSLCRSTAKMVGKDAIRYANTWKKDIEGLYTETFKGPGDFILEVAEEIGDNNVVFIRLSDEDDAYYKMDKIGLVDKISKNAVMEFEYH